MQICIIVKGGLVSHIMATRPVKVIVVDQDSDSVEPWVSTNDVVLTENFTSDPAVFSSPEEMEEVRELQFGSDIQFIPENKQVKMILTYRTASNYKTHFEVITNIDDHEDIRSLSAGDTIEMGTYGTPCEADFFNSAIHQYPYQHDDDHNQLEIDTICFPDELP